jgi:methylated-DNA-[protein]-cysteine S-methyltransferase
MKNRFQKSLNSPVGTLTLIAEDEGLVAVLWMDDRPSRVKVGKPEFSENHPVILHTERQITEYFGGKRRSFDLPLKFYGTDFQTRVWRALRAIPFGETRSYKDLAVEVGSPQACRAVGAANGRNPLSIIVPCHRVIGASGKLTGFAGGLATKDWLLKFENPSFSQPSQSSFALL